MTDLPKTIKPKPRNVLTKDKMEEYKHELGDLDITPEQAEEYVRAIWDIMVGFMSLQFGTDTTQQSGYQSQRELAPNNQNMIASSNSQYSTQKQSASTNAVTEKESK